MDMAPMILICTPIMLRELKAMGRRSVHFGMIMLLNLASASLPRPVGPTLFVGCAIGKVTMEEVSRELWPFYGAIAPRFSSSPTSRGCRSGCRASWDTRS